MTITVTAPNGATVQFPDGTDHDTINSVMMQHFQSGPTPDKYQQAAQSELHQMQKSGAPVEAGFTRRLAHGATLGADSTLLAAAQAPLEAIKRGVPLSEGYNYAKAREDALMDESRKNTGALGTAAEVLGGGVAGGGLARGGLTFARNLAPEAGLLARSAASAGDAAAIGGFSGAMEGNGLEDRAKNALKGALIGGAVGGVLPPALAAGEAAISPVVSNLRARINPEGYAQSQIARAVSESGRTPQQVGQEVANANAAGQPFTLADALGNPGQRMLSTVARAPGEGRTNAVEFLNARQAGQGDRVGQIVDEALGTGETAQQTIERLTQQARRESAPLYRSALNRAPVWNDRMQQFFNDPIAQQGLREGVGVQRLESLASGQPFNPQDYAITAFNEAGDPIISGVPNMRTINLIKKGWDNMLEQYRDPTTGRLALDERGRALDQVRRAFLNEVDALNPTYAQARRIYAGPAQAREAVSTGQQMESRGRAADNIARFENMNDLSQQGARAGYADKLQAKIENAPVGNNKVRPLTAPKKQAELTAMSLHQGPVQPGRLDPLQQRLAREQTMFETRNQALGNSKTAENLADEAAMGVDPHLVGQLLHGNWMGAARSLLHASSNVMTGNTPAVREAVGRILLDQGVNPAALDNMIGRTFNRLNFVRQLARNLGRGAAGGLATQLPTPSRR